MQQSLSRHFWQIVPARSGRAAARLEPVLARFCGFGFYFLSEILLLFRIGYSETSRMF
jgi:hypothetical protein